MSSPVDRDILLEFFLTFSRMECALKETGLFKKPGGSRSGPCGAVRGLFGKKKVGAPEKLPSAEPDWDKFTISLRPKFNPKRTPDLEKACQQFLDSPPFSQVILDGVPAWETPIRPKGEKDVDFILRMVRIVRNNLFHGGEYGTRFQETPEMIEARLKSALVVLQECRHLSPVQDKVFQEAAL